MSSSSPRRLPATSRVQSIELYDDGVIVRWISTTAEATFESHEEGWTGYGPKVTGPVRPLPRFRELDDEELRLSDDAGTQYLEEGGGGSSDYEVMRGDVEFTPAVPSNARRLKVSFRDRPPIEIDLAGSPTA